MRHLWIYGAMVLVAFALAVGAGGFTSGTSDRSVEILVAEDENALLGIHEGETTGRVGELIDVMYLEDNFGAAEVAYLVDVSLDPQSGPSGSSGGPVTLQGQTDTPTMLDTSVTVRCRGPTEGSEPVSVTLEVEADGVTVTATRTVDVTCHMPEESESGNETAAPVPAG